MVGKKAVREMCDFDVIVVGAGVAGLYQLYKLLKLKLQAMISLKSLVMMFSQWILK